MSQMGSYRISIHLAIAVLVFSGCAQQMSPPKRICPGSQSVVESLDSLRSRSKSIVPLKANGRCHLRYFIDNKEHDENFPVKIWFNPPNQIYLQCDVAFDPKGIVLGSNEDEFWLSIRLKEIDSYWWGKWEELGDFAKIRPGVLFEALGVAKLSDEGNLFLTNENGFDVITEYKRDIITKKIYINSCDNLVSKIEYFDLHGQAAITIELGEYKKGSAGFDVPRVIKIISRNENGSENSFRIKLRSVKPIEFTKSREKLFFSRAGQQGFKHIYKVVEGDIIEQFE